MDRFRRYLGCRLNLQNLKNDEPLRCLGIACTYAPDPPEDFDEFEFRTCFRGEDNVVITIALELGIIKRIMFGETDADNPDVVKSLTASRLDDFLAAKGDQLVRFFQYITGGEV
ncbi:MAG: hypothetical protein AB1776_03425 [Bacillota bacterium]